MNNKEQEPVLSMPAIALMLSFWVARRNGLLALGAALAVAVAAAGMSPTLVPSETLRNSSFVGFGLSLFGVFALSNFTETRQRGHGVGYPARLFTLPVSTFSLVTWPMAAAIATLLLAYVGWARLVFLRLDVHMPLGWPSLYLAAGMSAFLASVWSLAPFRVARLILVGVGGTVFPIAWVVFSDQAGDSWMAAYLPRGGIAPVRWALLSLMGLVPYLVSLWVVGRERRGAQFRVDFWPRILDGLGELVSRRRDRFQSASQALAWVEWRRQGMMLPLSVGAILLLIVTVSWLWRPLSPRTTVFTLFWMVLTPLVLAWAMGKGLGKIDFWAKDSRFPVFFATRPVADVDWLLVKAKVGFVAALSAWLLVGSVTPVWLMLCCEGDALQNVWKLAPADSSFVRALIWTLLLGSAVLATARFLVGSLYVGMSGVSWLLGLAVCGMFAGAFGVMLFAVWLGGGGELRALEWLVPAWFPAAVAAIFVFRIVAAIFLADHAIRVGLLEAGLARRYLRVWTFATGGLVVLVWLAMPFGGWRRDLAAMLALFGVPVWRTVLALWMVALNRHRRPGFLLPFNLSGRSSGTSAGSKTRGLRRYEYAVVSIVACGCLAWSATSSLPRDVRVGGGSLRVAVAGRGSPTVVFWGIENWDRVWNTTGSWARELAWERSPVKASAEGQRLRSPYHAAAELHELLESGRVRARPPFILVAHSFDAALARVFASLYPTDVAGLVLVDPFQPEFMDWLKEHQPTNFEAFVKLGETRYVPSWDRAMAELREASALPDVPVTVLTSVNRTRQEHDAMEQGISVEEWRAGAAAIVEAQRQGLSNVPQGILEEVDGASHNLPQEQPALVARAIEEVWVKARR